MADRSFRRVRGWAPALALWFLAAPAHAFDLAELMAGFAAVKSASATFVERRTVFELDRTLESSGRLSYEAPDIFTRETLKPHHEKVTVSGNELSYTSGGRTRSMQVDATPEAQAAVEAMRGTLSGNRALLDSLFELHLDGSRDDWKLMLVPREARLRGQIASVRMAGRGAEIREVTVTFADGDHSVMQIEPVVAPVR